MYKIFHNHETGVITIGETIPEGARIQCLDLATAQNTVRALNAVEAIADAVENRFATGIVEDAEPLAEWERELLEAESTKSPAIAQVDAAALATLRDVLEGGNLENIEAAAHGMFDWTEKLGLGQ